MGPGGDKTIEAQSNAMMEFTRRIENATLENKTIIILGDANLCSDSWDSPDFVHKKVAEELLSIIHLLN